MNENGDGKDERTIEPCPICQSAGTFNKLSANIYCSNAGCPFVHINLEENVWNALSKKVSGYDEVLELVDLMYKSTSSGFFGKLEPRIRRCLARIDKKIGG